MNIDQFNQLLEQQFKSTASEQVHDAQVWRLRKPRSLALRGRCLNRRRFN